MGQAQPLTSLSMRNVIEVKALNFSPVCNDYGFFSSKENQNVRKQIGYAQNHTMMDLTVKFLHCEILVMMALGQELRLMLSNRE